MKNLLGRLMGRSFEDLKIVAQHWQVPLADLNHNDAAIALYREMGEKPAMRAVWSRMDPEARAFMRTMLQQRNNLALLEDLPLLLLRSEEDIQPVLEGVAALGLVDVEEALVRGNRVVSAGDNLYNWGVRNLAPPTKKAVISVSNEVTRALGAVLAETDSAAPFGEPLTVLLERLEQVALERIANRWSLPDLRYISKQSLIEMLDSLLESRQVREQMLKDLPPEAHRVFDLVSARGGRAPTLEVADAAGMTTRELRQWFNHLEAHALAFETLWEDACVLFVPRQVQQPELAAEQEVPALEPIPAPPAIESRTPTELAWDLLSMLAHFKQNEVAYNLHNGELPRRALKRIGDSFIHPAVSDHGAAYIRLLLHFADAQGLTHEEEKTRQIITEPRLDDWVRLSFPAQTLRLFQRWLEDRRLREDPAQPFYIWRTPDPTAARKRLIKELAACPLDTWFAIDDLLHRIQAGDPYLLYSKDEVLRHGGINALRQFQANWQKNEGALLRSMIAGVLFWFGVLDIGLENGKPVAFRVTRGGARLIGHPAGAEERQIDQKPILVQPNFEVLVLAPESPPLWSLLLCSDLVRHDLVSVYAINKESVMRARASGINAAQLHEFLKAGSQKQVPQNVLQCISDWARDYKRTLLREATLIEVEEPEVLEELLASRRLRGYIVRRLSPTVAMIDLSAGGSRSRPDPLQKLARELRAAGFFPEVSEEVRAAERARPRPGRPDQAADSSTRKPAGQPTNGVHPRVEPLARKQQRHPRKGRFPAAS